MSEAEGVATVVAAPLSRRDQYARLTRQAVVDAALDCFVEYGYVGTSLTEVGRRAQVTRGAVYHHFAGKQPLFEEIFVQLQIRNVEALSAAAAEADPDDASARSAAALTVFLDLCATEPFRSIVMQQGPVALGWQRWRELDQRYTIKILEAHVADLEAAGLIGLPVSPVLIQVLYAALHETAELVANAAPEQRVAVRAESVGVLLRFLSGLGLPLAPTL